MARRAQSAPSASIGSRPSSVQSPSPGAPREPASARLTTVECVWKPSVRFSLVRADLGAQAAVVLVDALDVVARPAPEVQRLERPFADAAGARREDDVVRARNLPAEQRNAHDCSTSSRAASSSDSRPASSPFSLRRRTSARISPTRGDSPSPSRARSAPSISSSIASEAPEEVAQLRPVGEREREERRVGGARLGERDDVGRGQRVSPELLGDPRAVLDRGGDQLGVAAADLEAVRATGRSPRAEACAQAPRARGARREPRGRIPCSARGGDRRAARPPRPRRRADGSPSPRRARPAGGSRG